MSVHVLTLKASFVTQQFPQGTVSAGVQMLVAGDPSNVVPPQMATLVPAVPASADGSTPAVDAFYQAVFSRLNSGINYTCTTQAVDNTGAVIGSSFSTQVNIPADGPTTVSVDIPTGLTASVV